MLDINRAICLEVERALEESTNKNKTFIETLYELGIISPNLDMNESSETTYGRMKERIVEVVPKTPIECLRQIERICNDAIRTYDNEEFFEDDCERFMGESIMAQNVIEIIAQVDSFVKMLEEHEKDN